MEENIQTNVQQQDPKQVQAQEPVQQADQQPAQVDFKELTGGKFEKWEQVDQALNQIVQERDAFKGEVEKMRTTQYADDFSKRFDEMRRAGASQDDLLNFVKVQSIDVDKLSNEDAIREAMRLAEGLSEREIDAIMKREYTPSEDDDDDARALLSAKAKREAVRAREVLSSKKVQLSETGAMAAQRQQQEAKQQNAKQWEGQLPNILNGIKAGTSWKDGDNEFSFDVPYTTDPDLVKFVENDVRNQGLPLNANTAAQAKEIYEALYYIKHKQKILETVGRNFYSKGLEAGINSQSNNTPPKRPENRQEPISGGVDLEALRQRVIAGKK